MYIILIVKPCKTNCIMILPKPYKTYLSEGTFEIVCTKSQIPMKISKQFQNFSMFFYNATYRITYVNS